MPHGIKGFTAQQRTLFKKGKVFLFVAFRLQRNSHQVDSIDLDRTDRKCRAADGVDESIEL